MHFIHVLSMRPKYYEMWREKIVYRNKLVYYFHAEIEKLRNNNDKMNTRNLYFANN